MPLTFGFFVFHRKQRGTKIILLTLCKEPLSNIAVESVKPSKAIICAP
jgi:hypothetical protein